MKRTAWGWVLVALYVLFILALMWAHKETKYHRADPCPQSQGFTYDAANHICFKIIERPLT